LETPIDRAEGGDEDEGGAKKKNSKRPAGASAATVPDPGVWAREIKLLESLIGMDAEGEEFRELERKLAEEGAEMRKAQLEQYERKLETEKKKEAKGKGKQKSLTDMMKGGGKKD
jgi:AP endonuclease-1